MSHFDHGVGQVRKNRRQPVIAHVLIGKVYAKINHAPHGISMVIEEFIDCRAVFGADIIQKLLSVVALGELYRLELRYRNKPSPDEIGRIRNFL
ncbi:MAG: hypothetical protein MK171_02915 [Pirellulales bacterium]|nr:hypothetical protein [Pirellulales bacterium]